MAQQEARNDSSSTFASHSYSAALVPGLGHLWSHGRWELIRVSCDLGSRLEDEAMLLIGVRGDQAIQKVSTFHFLL